MLLVGWSRVKTRELEARASNSLVSPRSTRRREPLLSHCRLQGLINPGPGKYPC